MSSYQPGIPTGTVNLDVDYLNIQANFQQLDTSFGIDHLPFSNQTAQNGYHQNIHFNPFSTTVTNPPNNYVPATSYPASVPAATSGFGQLFSCQVNDGINLDEALFWLSGGNRLSPLTRNFAPSLGTSGKTYLPGGIIMQWGQQAGLTSGITTATVNFTSYANVIAFPNACFFMTGVPFYTGTAPSSTGSFADVWFRLISKTQFRFTFNTNSNATDGFMWLALGN